MFIQGDVLAFVSLLLGTCFSAWALTIAYGLLFPERSEMARQIISDQPWKCVGRGALILATAGFLSVVLISAPNPVIKLVGWLVALVILLMAALGLAGIALNAGERMRRMAPETSHFAAFSRGAAFMIAGCILPIVGWLAFGPLLFLASIGAGVKSALTRTHQSSPLTHLETA